MDGRKLVERKIETSVLLDGAVASAQGHGFVIPEQHPGLTLLGRQGTQFTLQGEKFPLDLALAESESGIFLQLRYDTFVLFDTGDLEELADRLVDDIARAQTHTSGA